MPNYVQNDHTISPGGSVAKENTHSNGFTTLVRVFAGPRVGIKRGFYSAAYLSLTVLLGACIAPTAAWSQAAPETSLGSAQDAEAATDATAEYEASEKALREHLKAMRIQQVEFHMSETPARDREFRQNWADLCDAGRPIFARALKSMIQKYSANPADEQELAALLYELLDQNVKYSRFEGMLELGLALEQGGLIQEKLAPMIAMCAVADNKYALAKKRMESVPEASRPLLPVLAVFAPVIEQLQQEWEKELKMRAEDAQGEPLPQVKIRTTKGSFVIELFENQCPETVGNFIHLVEKRFYDGHTFHRVLEHFVAQTGCPEGDGSGGPGYTIYGEMNQPNSRKFFRGTLGLALSKADPNSGGSQFFISFLPTYNLNQNYTAFGRIISGIEVIGTLNQINPDQEKKKDEPTLTPDEVVDMTVLRKRNHPYEPHKVTR